MLNSIETLNTNKRFDGFRNTSFLWSGLLEDLEMFELGDISHIGVPSIDSTSHIRLGKLIEQFVFHELDNVNLIQILKSNIQVFQSSITIGELDCLIKRLDEYIHLEIVYKFYLYDPRIGGELNRWIGPNRNDSLVQKLDKLKQKQLPLLYHPETAKHLNEISLTATDFKQEVYFKTQLFVPFNSLSASLPLVNNDCIKGFYIRLSDLTQFKNQTFFVPLKLDWIVEPNLDVEWLSIAAFQDEVLAFLKDEKSPLCWMKSAGGEIQQFFVVWWK